MFKLLDIYMGKVVLGSSLMTMSLVLILRAFFMYMEELRDVGRGSYDSIDALIYVLLSCPNLLYEYFPVCVLVGGLLGLGTLANNSELQVMRSAGVSTYSIAFSVMKSTFLLMLVVIAIGEWVAPAAIKYGRQLRTLEMSSGQLVKNNSGIWLKENRDFIHVDDIYATGDLAGITIIRLDDNYALSAVYEAQSGSFDLEQSRWLLRNVNFTKIDDEEVRSSKFKTMNWDSQFLSPDNVNVVGLHPNDLNFGGLLAYKAYLNENGLKSTSYELALWNKVLMPVSTGVMMFLALSFIFGPLRSTSMGARILLGVCVGFGFHMTSRIFGNLAHEMPPAMSAVLPSLVFAMIAWVMMRRAG